MIEAGSIIRAIAGRPAARNYHNFVINEIGRAVVSGVFPAGSVLAGDAEMMEKYGVSRTVLREAMKTLEAKGLVEGRPKVGTRVLPKSRWNLFDVQVLAWHLDAPPDPHFIDDLFEVRRALEGQAAAHAAKRRSAEHVRLMKYWVHQMDLAGDNIEALGIAALELHLTLAESSDNTLLRSISGVIELSIAVALRRHKDAGFNVFRLTLGTKSAELVKAVELGEGEIATAAVLAIVDHTSIWAKGPETSR